MLRRAGPKSLFYRRRQMFLGRRGNTAKSRWSSRVDKGKIPARDRREVSVNATPSFRTTAAPHEHSVHFYGDDAMLIEGLRQFIGDALGRGCSAVVVATEAHSEALRRELTRDGIDVAKAIDEWRYVSVGADYLLSQFVNRGRVDRILFYDAVGNLLSRAAAGSKEQNRRVVVFGEMVALLWSSGNAAAAIDLEKLWNGLSRICSFSLRCAYPVEGFREHEDADSLLEICAEHSSVIPADFGLR
jgi:hypothetical protein